MASKTSSGGPQRRATDLPRMIVRSNPVLDASQMARELQARIGDQEASRITHATSIRLYFSDQQISLHGTDFLKIVVDRIAFANRVHKVTTDWLNRNCANAGQMKRIPSASNVQDLFTAEDLAKQPGALMQTAFQVLKDMYNDFLSTEPQPQPSQTLPSASASVTPDLTTVDHTRNSSVNTQSISTPFNAAPSSLLSNNTPVPRSQHLVPRSSSLSYTRRVVSEPKVNFQLTHANAYGNLMQYKPTQRATPMQRFPSTMSNTHASPRFDMPHSTPHPSSHARMPSGTNAPSTSYAPSPHQPPFFPEANAPTLHGQMIRNGLAHYHGIHVMPIQHAQSTQQAMGPVIAPQMFIPQGGHPGGTAMFPMMNPISYYAGNVFPQGAEYQPPEQYERLGRERRKSMRGTGPVRGRGGNYGYQHAPRFHDNNAPNHSQWKFKQSPTARRMSMATEQFPDLTSDVPVAHRITKDFIGADVEDILRLWVHGIPKMARAEDVKSFFESSVAIAEVVKIMTDRNDINYTYVW